MRIRAGPRAVLSPPPAPTRTDVRRCRGNCPTPALSRRSHLWRGRGDDLANTAASARAAFENTRRDITLWNPEIVGAQLCDLWKPERTMLTSRIPSHDGARRSACWVPESLHASGRVPSHHLLSDHQPAPADHHLQPRELWRPEGRAARLGCLLENRRATCGCQRVRI